MPAQRLTLPASTSHFQRCFALGAGQVMFSAAHGESLLLRLVEHEEEHGHTETCHQMNQRYQERHHSNRTSRKGGHVTDESHRQENRQQRHPDQSEEGSGLEGHSANSLQLFYFRLQPSDVAALVNPVDSATEHPVERVRLPPVGKIRVDRNRNSVTNKSKGNGSARINRKIALPGAL
jgi:hypothetical protein